MTIFLKLWKLQVSDVMDNVKYRLWRKLFFFTILPIRTDHAGSHNNLFSIYFFFFSWNSSFQIGQKRNGRRVWRLQSSMSFGCGFLWTVDSIIRLHYAHSHLNPLSLMLQYFSCTVFITWYFRSAALAVIVRARKKIRTLGGEQGKRRE